MTVNLTPDERRIFTKVRAALDEIENLQTRPEVKDRPTLLPAALIMLEWGAEMLKLAWGFPISEAPAELAM